MRRTAVECEAASTNWKLRLKESGFDDEQAQAVLEVTGAGEERREGADDVAELSQEVTALKLRATATEDRFDHFRDEIVARIEASEERVKGDIATLGTELRGDIATLGTELRSDIATLGTELLKPISRRSEPSCEAISRRSEPSCEAKTRSSEPSCEAKTRSSEPSCWAKTRSSEPSC